MLCQIGVGDLRVAAGVRPLCFDNCVVRVGSQAG